MYCRKCGKKIPDDAVFCPECGAKQTVPGVQTQRRGGHKMLWLKILLPVLAVAVLLTGVVWMQLKNEPEKNGKSSENAENTVQMTDGSSIEESTKLFRDWSSGVVNGTSSLTVDVECMSITDAEYEDTPLMGEYSNNAEIFFSDGNVHLLGEGTRNQKIDQRKLFLRGKTLAGDGEEVNDSTSTEVYVMGNDSQKFWEQEGKFGYTEKEADESGIISLDLYLGFIDSIRNNLDYAQIEETEDGGGIEIKGTIPGKDVCDAYLQILYMTGVQPEYKTAEQIPYTLNFSSDKMTIESLEFDLGEIAEYIWYGSADDGLIFYEVTGDFKIAFRDFNQTEKVVIPESLYTSDQKESTKDTDWKKAYTEYVTDSLEEADSLNGYNIQDINNDGIPELFVEYPMTYGELMFYVDGNGNARLNDRGGVIGYSPETGTVWTATGHGMIEDSFCRYNERSGEFEAEHVGRYDTAEELYELDGKSYGSYEEYSEAVKTVFDTDNYMKVEFTDFSTGDKSEELLDAIQNY